MTATLSLVVPAFNEERRLPVLFEAIRTGLPDDVAAAGLQLLEVVVVDDGSTDDSSAVLDPYSGQVRLLFKANGGQASAFNAGFEACSGDLIVFLDADDVLPPDSVSLSVAALLDRPRVGAVQARLCVTDASLTPTGQVVPPSYVRLADGDVADEVRQWRSASTLSPGGAWMFRRDVLTPLFPLSELELRFGADFFITRGVALLAPVATRPGVSALYRSHGTNDSNLTQLSATGLRRSLLRHVAYGRMLAQVPASTAPLDPLQAADPVFLSQRLASIVLEPAEHPFDETAWQVSAAGVRAALARDDVSVAARLAHAAWFLVVYALPRRPAVVVAELLLQPASRQRWVARLRTVLRHRGRAHRHR